MLLKTDKSAYLHTLTHESMVYGETIKDWVILSRLFKSFQAVEVLKNLFVQKLYSDYSVLQKSESLLLHAAN